MARPCVFAVKLRRLGDCCLSKHLQEKAGALAWPLSWSNARSLRVSRVVDRQSAACDPGGRTQQAHAGRPRDAQRAARDGAGGRQRGSGDGAGGRERCAGDCARGVHPRREHVRAVIETAQAFSLVFMAKKPSRWLGIEPAHLVFPSFSWQKSQAAG